MPVPDRYTRFFWEGTSERKLLILRCQNCGTYIHLPRPVCRVCHSFDLAPEEVSGRGTLYSYTVTYKPFHPFFVDRVPYVVAVVELAEQGGLRIVSNLVGVDESAIEFGMPLQVDFEELDPELTVPVFRPAPEAVPTTGAKPTTDAADATEAVR
jgi:uncharacterized OB-fold protein